jgi:pseudaminic acid biosynthesis-associated methylase
MKGNNYQTEQESFWSGSFGDDYIERNKSDRLLASNVSFFAKALKTAGKIDSIIEFGANVGMNLRALGVLYPEINRFAIEINQKASDQLKDFLGAESVFNGSIFDYSPVVQYDVSFIKGVLIHINPDYLGLAYKALYESSRKYILICEYYNPVPVEVEYRGHSGKLFKRDFCGDIMSHYSNLKLVDYGFAYKKDPAFSQDDITWFLLEKQT